MSIAEKPFACTANNCNMKFTNEDHLNSHQKKHSMCFNLELISKTNETAIMVSDETPTPTSFFRNCEEVGLFQDLQNVNPFEETFKKALENSDNGAHRLDSISLVTCEDTLHTPHVFPVADEASGKSVVSDSNELSIMNFVEIPQISEKIDISSGVDSNIKVREKQENFRHKLKEALLRKDREKYIQKALTIDLPELVIKEEGIVYVNEKDSRNKNSNCSLVSEKQKICGNQSISPGPKSSIEKVREMNRAAQMRCRDKKKRYYDRVTKELACLMKENVQLREDNALLRQNTVQLWKIIEELGGTNGSNTQNIDVQFINDKSAQEANPRKLPVLAPAGKVLIGKNISVQQPVIYNLVPVQVVNNVPNAVDRVLTTVPKFVQEIKTSKSLPRILKKS